MAVKRTMILLLACLLAGCSSEHYTIVKTGDTDDGLWNYSEVAAERQPVFDHAPSGDYTLSFWIRPVNSEPDAVVLFDGDEDHYFMISSRGYDEGNRMFTGISMTFCDGEDILTVCGGHGLPTNRWSLITLRCKGNKTQLFMDEVLCAEADRRADLQQPVFGGTPLGMKSVAGKISDIRLTNSLTEDPAEAYILQKPRVLLDLLEYPDQDHLRRSLWFDSVEIEGEPVQFTVESNETMNYLGTLVKTDEDADVTVHARMDIHDVSAEKTFIFHVEGDRPEVLFKEDCDGLDRMIDGVVFSRTALPSAIGSTQITYSVSDGAHLEGTVLVKDAEEERLPVTLKASLDGYGLQAEKTYDIILLDKAYGYVMSYFNGEPGEETGYTAISTDGLNWEKTGGDPLEGFSGYSVRDPHINRRSDGGFVVTATASGDTPFILLWDSEDLCSWENARAAMVGYPDPGIYMSGTKAWAPDLYYDNENDLYWVYFSDPGQDRGPIYCVTSHDLQTFSYPQIFFDPQYPVIDASLFAMDGKYWMIYKDERKAAQTVYSASTEVLGSRIFRTYDYKHLILERAVEGPIVFRDIHDGRWHIYLDHFSEHTFLAGTFSGLDYEHTVDWSDTSLLHLPEDDVRHGSVIPVTEKEYERLRNQD
ncbi:MAG: family 43 glycosylhydrolase [Solobacterium sp.]|nr:family 43 glycosylhydrolase [Solobacterium sp.]